MGEVAGGKKMGNKAAAWGAVAGTIPDLDVFIRGLIHPIDGALMHRGFSHSILFALIASPILAWLLNKLYRQRYGYKQWLWLFFLGIITHPMLDIFTNYGTQFFWPFDLRLTFNSIFVVDPLYTIPFSICLVIALFLKKESRRRRIWNYAGIGISCLYLLWCVSVKIAILNQSDNYFAQAGIESTDNLVTPMPFTSFYWMMLGQDSSNYYVGYKSLFYDFNSNDINIVAKNHATLNKLKWVGTNYTDKIHFITEDYYSVVADKDTIKVYDLRFGLAAKATKEIIDTPIKGFGMVIDNGFVKKTYGLRPTGLWKHVNFSSYYDKIFNE